MNELQAVIKFIKNEKCKSVIINGDLSVIWSNLSSFNVGDTFYLTSYCNVEFPIYRSFTTDMLIGENLYTAMISPFKITYETLYVCRLYYFDDVMKMTLNSELKNKADTFSELLKENLSNLTTLLLGIEMLITDKFSEQKEYIDRSILSLTKILMQAEDFRYFMGEYSGSSVNILETMERIVHTCNKSLAEINRKIIYETDLTEILNVGISQKALDIVFMNMFQNMVLTSPPNTDIYVKLTCTDSDFASIDIECKLSENNINTDTLSADAARRIIAQVNGKILEEKTDKEAKTKISIPTTSAPENLVLNSEKKNYGQTPNDRFSAVNLRLFEIIDKEKKMKKETDSLSAQGHKNV